MAKLSEKQLWGAEKGMKAWEAMVSAMSEEERAGKAFVWSLQD